MKTLDMAKTRIEALKQEAITAVESGKFSKEAPDAEGITPQTRLEWVAPSADYILTVAATLPEKDIEAALNSVEGNVMFAFIATVEVMSHDVYVTEGKANLKNALTILEGAGVNERGIPEAEAEDEAEDDDDEKAESLLDKAACFFKNKFGRKKKDDDATVLVERTPRCRLEKPESLEQPHSEVKKLRAQVEDLEQQLSVMRKRALKAETEVNELKSKYESPLNNATVL